jgi:tyrosine-protein kinase Etk/Wzc
MVIVPAEEEISLLDLVVVLARNRRFILKTTLIITLIALLAAFLIPSKYTASTAILPPQNSSVGSALMAQLGAIGSLASLGGGSLGLKNPNDLQVALLKSQTVEDAMVDRFHLMNLFDVKRRSQARKKLESIANIDSGSKDGIIRISVTQHDPKLAADMANGYVEEFKKYSSGLAVTEASQRRLFFEGQLAQAKDNLAKAEEDLKKTEQRTGLIQLDSQARATISLVADLRGQIAAKEAQIAAMRTYATDENPELQIAQQELAGLQAQAKKMGATSESATNPLLPKGNMQEAALEYVRRYRDVKYYETIFDLIARQYEIAKVDEAKQGAIIQVVDHATVPDHRSFPSKLIFTAVGIFLGLFIGVAYTLAKEGLLRLERNPSETERIQALRAAFAPARRQKGN